MPEVSIYYGTSQDISLLITFLPAFLFPQGECSFANVICAGISLGGHSTYLVLSNGIPYTPVPICNAKNVQNF